MATRAVLFDFYGTLAEAASYVSFAEIFERHGHARPAEARHWTEDHDGVDHLEHSVDREAYRAWERAKLREVVLSHGVGPDDADELVADLEAGGAATVMRAYPEVPGVLRALRERNVAVAVCSNWDWDLDVAVEQAGLTDLVDVQVTSARAGARKPHRRIFEHTLAALEVAPGDALFVGDTWRADVEGALGAGLRPVHVRRTDQGSRSRLPEAPPLPEGVWRVADLTGVLGLL